MSFIVHPAPRIMNAPVPKRANIWRSGKAPAEAAKAILHPQGQNSNQLPDREFRRERRLKYM